MTAPLILSLETATMGGSVWLGYGTVELATLNRRSESFAVSYVC